jgi:class 3 adenylate cyclase
VNVAARLCSEAAADQLLINGGAVAAAPAHLAPVALGAITVPGVSQSIDVYALDPDAVAARRAE